MLTKNQTLNYSDIGLVKKRFLALNRERLARTHSALRDKQSAFLEILPLLFHVNHASLPGFITKDTPAGISEYRPGDKTIATVKRFARTFNQKRRALLRYDIFSLFLMGSGGTVAYTKKSDFDIWICYNKEITGQRLEELRQKGLAIEQWAAASFDLEVHFFLVEPESFSQGVHEDMSAESSGSAQHFLLMEEFYRTGLVLAGRYPIWWLVPPDEEANYKNYTAMLRRKRFISDSEAIDLGPMAGVPTEEFFGAALWQLYKSIDSPYKSALKLMMMEAYAYEYPNVELLCHRFKKAIYEGEVNLDQLDPYIILYKKIEDYLLGREETERLELIRRCFYFKVNEPLSVVKRRLDDDWRRELMLTITKSWEWSPAYLEMLDSRSKWKIDRVLNERNVLVKALTFSYQFLSDFARRHAQLVSISQHDLNILGRKLYAAFERKAGKVEIVNRGISQNLWESHLTFYRATKTNEDEAWLLYTAPLNVAEARRDRPLRRSHSLIELLAWCHFNTLLDDTTVLAMHSEDGSVTPREVKEMLFCFQRLFPADKLLKTDMNDFASGGKAVKVAVFINLGVDPMLEYTKQGKHLMSGRTDALRYGGLGENLAVSFDLITVTNWKEVLTSRYTGVDGLLACLRDYLRWAPVAKNETPPEISAQCFSFGRGLSIRQRIEELFRDVASSFYGEQGNSNVRYVLAVENAYYVLSLENKSLNYDRVNTYQGLIQKLAMGNATYCPVVIDRHALNNTVLPAVFSVNKPRVIQMCYEVIGKSANVYILDERGSLCYQRMTMVDRRMLIYHFNTFFRSVLHRQYYEVTTEEGNSSEVEGIEYYEIIRRDRGKQVVMAKKEAITQCPINSGMTVQVIGEARKEEPGFTIYCDDKEFSSIEHGRELFREAAQYVFSKRKSGDRYPIYITDMDLPPALLGGDVTHGNVQTIHVLNYKKRIEKQLNDALAQIKEQR